MSGFLGGVQHAVQGCTCRREVSGACDVNTLELHLEHGPAGPTDCRPFSESQVACNALPNPLWQFQGPCHPDLRAWNIFCL